MVPSLSASCLIVGDGPPAQLQILTTPLTCIPYTEGCFFDAQTVNVTGGAMNSPNQTFSVVCDSTATANCEALGAVAITELGSGRYRFAYSLQDASQDVTVRIMLAQTQALLANVTLLNDNGTQFLFIAAGFVAIG